jgi:hypothetical protein
VTLKHTFILALLTLIACASDDPGLMPPDLGSPCQVEAYPEDPMDFWVELSSVQCMHRVCAANLADGDFSTYPTTREECEAMPELMGECDDYQPAAVYDELVYCSCRCPDVCACDAPGFECRLFQAPDFRYCVKSE